MMKFCLVYASLLGLVSVIFAAGVAHLLAGHADPVQIGMVQAALQMQGWHALALLFCGLWIGRLGKGQGALLARAGAACLALGVLVFCGAVYAFALAHADVAGAAPVGGMLLMLGWALLAASALRAL